MVALRVYAERRMAFESMRSKTQPVTVVPTVPSKNSVAERSKDQSPVFRWESGDRVEERERIVVQKNYGKTHHNIHIILCLRQPKTEFNKKRNFYRTRVF